MLLSPWCSNRRRGLQLSSRGGGKLFLAVLQLSSRGRFITTALITTALRYRFAQCPPIPVFCIPRNRTLALPGRSMFEDLLRNRVRAASRLLLCFTCARMYTFALVDLKPFSFQVASHSTTKQLVQLAGVTGPEALRAIGSVMKEIGKECREWCCHGRHNWCN